jgi:hypothetical protein
MNKSKINNPTECYSAEITENKTEIKSSWTPSMSDFGCAGKIVELVMPFTEAAALPVLIQILLFTAHVVGRRSFWSAGGSKHFLNQFVLLMGPTSIGRKGTSTALVKSIFQEIDDAFCQTQILRGLSSGEGLIHHLKARDLSPTGKTLDQAKSDSLSCIIIEEEFVNVLKVIKREGNTLSGNLRSLWDAGTLQTLVKNNPAVAYNTFGSLIAHITPHEFVNCVDEVDFHNGVLNRFIFIECSRSKLLPLGDSIPTDKLLEVKRVIQKVIKHAKTVNEITFTDRGKELWTEIYYESFSGNESAIADLTARNIPILRRLACSFAMFDCQNQVDVQHINAARIITDHSRDVCTKIFSHNARGSNSQSETKLLRAINASEEGLTRTEILKVVFHKNKSADEIADMIQRLLAEGEIFEDLSCNPPRWKATGKPNCVDGYDQTTYDLSAKSKGGLQ